MNNPAYRQLTIFQQLLNGQVVQKSALVNQFEVTPRVIQRDLSQIRQFITDQQLFYDLTYSRKLGGYLLTTTQASVPKQAILVLIKILLASRSLTPNEMTATIDGLLQLIPLADQQAVQPIIKNERFYYVPLHHDRPLLQLIWQFSQFIIKKQAVNIDYQRARGDYKSYLILPEAVIFSEYYFYVISYSTNGHGQRFFRLDRIRDYRPAPITIDRSYAERVEDGALRRYLQYMQPGQKMTVQFEFSGIVEAALDRFPGAIVKARYPERNTVLIEAQAAAQGAKMWLLSQGSLVKVMAPASLVREMRAEIERMRENY